MRVYHDFFLVPESRSTFPEMDPDPAQPPNDTDSTGSRSETLITGLIAAANLVSDVTVLPVISLKVVRLLSFKNHLVRVKALVTLDRCCQISPSLWTEAEGSVLGETHIKKVFFYWSDH